MSVHAMAWAFDQPCPPISRLVLLVLADHADETGRCYPSLTRIITRTGLSRDALCRAIADLTASGLIDRKRGHAEDRTSTVYTLHCTGKQYGSRTSPGAVLVRETDRSSPGDGLKQYGSRTRTVKNRKEPKQSATAMRDNQPITEAQRAFAVSVGVNPATEWPIFVDYWVGTGKPMKDWDATWRNWCRRSLTFASGRRPSKSSTSDDPRFVALLAANPELAS